jgi:hypothetical protein
MGSVLFAGSDSTMIKDRKFRNRGRIRATCAILPLGAGNALLGMMTRPWERGLLARMQGMAVALFFIWLSAALRMRGSRESSTTWHGYATACQESIQPKAMWAPALVPPPLIGRHRSRMQLGCAQSHPSNGVSPNACNASVNGDQPY